MSGRTQPNAPTERSETIQSSKLIMCCNTTAYLVVVIGIQGVKALNPADYAKSLGKG